MTSIPQSRVPGPADSGTPPEGVRAALGQVTRATLRRALYRLHTAHSASAADRLVADAYPDSRAGSAYSVSSKSWTLRSRTAFSISG